MTLSQNTLSEIASKALPTLPWSPEYLLVVRGFEIASYRGLQVLAADQGRMRQTRVATWPEGKLDTHRAELMLSMIATDLGHSLVHRFGVQGELYEAFA